MFSFINIAMLAGLAGLALPVLAHLLSKRKFDVVQWGAMRFLELGRRTRRRIRLEELLLLLMRMGLIGLGVLAVARPWVQGRLLAGLSGGPSRDVVFVVDGSYSMGWEGRTVTPQAGAIQWVHEALESLRAGDAAGVLDARDQVRPVVEPLSSDLDYVRSRLATIPEPTGTSRLSTAIGQALRMLNAGTNLRRDVVILTDGQALPWTLADEPAWARLDAMQAESAIKPRLWAVDIGRNAEVARVNYSVDRLQLSRELTVPDFTVRIQTTIRQSGGETTRRQVYLEVNGQRFDDKTISVNLPPNGEAAVQFEHQFPVVGSFVVSVVLDTDHLPGDNRSDAAVVIEDGLPVLLVDGDPQADTVRSETFFAKSALTPLGVGSPWVQARTVKAVDLTPDDLTGNVAVFLCNVPQLTAEQVQALQSYVANGGGLVIAPGDQADPLVWNKLYADGLGLLPAALLRIASEDDAETRPVGIVSDSLQVPWLAMFRDDSSDGGFDLTKVRFAKWWQLSAVPVDSPDDIPQPPEVSDGSATPATVSPANVVARLSSGDPYLISKPYERGRVLLLAGPIDDAWSTLPGRRALAPLLHEFVFLLAGHQRGRNVETGAPLLFSLQRGDRGDRMVFRTPSGAEVPVVQAGDELHPEIRLNDTSIAGTYQLLQPSDPTISPQYFVVNADRSESDLTPLSPEQQQTLTADGRMTQVDSVEQLVIEQAEDAPRTEIWSALMCVVLGLLVCEVFLTRRLVQRGHEVAEIAEYPAHGRE
ncbi:MAG: BatA domain-containing protein [Planctomycetaceae bacterium]